MTIEQCNSDSAVDTNGREGLFYVLPDYHLGSVELKTGSSNSPRVPSAYLDLMLVGYYVPITMPKYADPVSQAEKNAYAHADLLDSIRSCKRGHKY